MVVIAGLPVPELGGDPILVANRWEEQAAPHLVHVRPPSLVVDQSYPPYEGAVTSGLGDRRKLPTVTSTSPVSRWTCSIARIAATSCPTAHVSAETRQSASRDQLDDHDTHATGRTPNASATTASAASVTWPATAGAATRTTRAPSCSPPTLVQVAPGRTRMLIRTAAV